MSTDASQHFEDLHKTYSPLKSTFNYKAGGGSKKFTITDEDFTEYLEDFKIVDDNNVIVPPLEQLDEKSLQYKITLSFLNKLSPKDNFLFTSVNLFQYLKGFGVTEEDFRTQFDGHLKDTSNTLILYPSGYAVVIIITLPENKTEPPFKIKLRANANVKAYQILHQTRLTKESKKLMVISVIGAVYQKTLPNSSSCNHCSKNNLIIYKDDFENDLKSWWRRFCQMSKELTKNYRIKYDAHFIEETASRLALYLGLSNDKFPSLFASDDERICKIRFNAAQREILLFNLDPRKIIIGKSSKLSINVLLYIYLFL